MRDATQEPRIRPRPYPLPPLPANRYYEDDPDPALLECGGLYFRDESDPFDSYTYRVQNLEYHGRTAHQQVTIADTLNFGRALVLDGAIQSAADDEALYQELLVQTAMIVHREPRDILIVGGGEGATLREVLVHGTVRSATMVDLDAELVELCREHLVSWHRGAFDDPRARLLFKDGREFVEADDARYDVVIIDVVDMLDNGPAQRLYTREFYEHLRARLRPNALVVVQGLEFSFLDDKPHAALARTLRTVFPEVHSYRAAIPSFLSAWGFLIASDWFRLDEMRPDGFDHAVANRLSAQALVHLDGSYLSSCFSLCKETRFLLSQPGPILEDGVEFVPPPSIAEIELSRAEFPIRIRDGA